MTRRVGRYTKNETAELTRMFGEGYSLYKICKNLNRSQKSIRNNLIRLGLIEGVITPVQSNLKEKNDKEKLTLLSNIFRFIRRFFILVCLSMLFLLEPNFNIVDIFLFNIFLLFEF